MSYFDQVETAKTIVDILTSDTWRVPAAEKERQLDTLRISTLIRQLQGKGKKNVKR